MQHQQESAHLGEQINQIILNASDDETRLLKIAQILGEAFQVDWCTIVTTDEQNTAQAVGHWCSHDNLTIPQQPLLSSLQQLAVVYAKSPLFVFDDVKTAVPNLIAQLPPEIGAMLGIPLWCEGKIGGVISFGRAQPYHWSEEEQASALAVATSVAIAIAQILQNRLIASLQQQVATSAQYQTLINQITMASRSSLDLDRIFQLALSQTAQTLKVDRGFILTLKYLDPLFKLRQRHKEIPQALAKVVCEWQSCHADLATSHSSINQFSISESSLCQQVLLNFPQPIVINSLEELSQLNCQQETTDIFDVHSWQALAILPLENQGTVLGFFVLQHSCAHLWQEDELALLELVSTQISTTIIQSQTLRQVQSLVEERTAQLQCSLEVQAKLYEKTRQQIDQLRQLNQLKDEFVSTMNHELRTPLTSMSLAIRMLRQPGLPTERQAKYLDILEQQCSQEINLINDLLRLQELESHKALLNVETVNLTTQLEHIACLFVDKWKDKGLAFTVNLPKTSLILQTDAESLHRILHELLTNAGKYSESNSTVKINAQHQNNQIVLQLINYGPGIAAEDVTHIFDKFRRGQGMTQQAIQGTGLGLALVKCLVQHINGAIAVSSNVSQSGSSEICFTLTLPLTLNQAQT
ncbi:GAF domain-containing sensor histidine kinase [Gloeocapsopsis dulcis]|nr:GAF domain-containing protein [Gloeocapsopsis dulcis]WNN91361.1 GAF domain-containing protein [Gloeocapsopsis dulcis]